MSDPIETKISDHDLAAYLRYCGATVYRVSGTWAIWNRDNDQTKDVVAKVHYDNRACTRRVFLPADLVARRLALSVDGSSYHRTWYVIGTGTDNGTQTYCHLLGVNPPERQAGVWVPNEALADAPFVLRHNCKQLMENRKMIKISNTKSDERYQSDAVSIDVKHTISKPVLMDILREILTVHGQDWLVGTLNQIGVRLPIERAFFGELPDSAPVFSLEVDVSGTTTKEQAETMAGFFDRVSRDGNHDLVNAAYLAVPDTKYMVSVDGARAPRHEHETLEGATAEAIRLAKKVNNSAFHGKVRVLALVNTFSVVTRTEQVVVDENGNEVKE